MTYPQFVEIFALLAVQLRASDADEGTIRAYFKAMKDLEPEFVAMAAQRFAQGDALNEQGEAWFPKAPEWCAMAGRVERDRKTELSAVLLKRRRVGQPLCRECEDTGWSLNAAQNRHKRCDCLEMRRLELLGRRPMPAVPALEPAPEPGQEARVNALIAQTVKGIPDGSRA